MRCETYTGGSLGAEGKHSSTNALFIFMIYVYIDMHGYCIRKWHLTIHCRCPGFVKKQMHRHGRRKHTGMVTTTGIGTSLAVRRGRTLHAGWSRAGSPDRPARSVKITHGMQLDRNTWHQRACTRAFSKAPSLRLKEAKAVQSLTACCDHHRQGNSTVLQPSAPG